MDWLRLSSWHYAIRLPCDVLLQGQAAIRRWGTVSPFRRSLPHSQCGVVGRWHSPLQSSFGDRFRCQGFLGSCHRRTAHFTNPLYALRFQIEELFLDSKSGAFELTVQGYAHRFPRAVVFGSGSGFALCHNSRDGRTAGWRQQVDPTGDVA